MSLTFTICQTLYSLVQEEAKLAVGGSKSSLGHEFEDKVAKSIWQCARLSHVQTLPPRHTLDLPTVSGQKHQFDAAYRVDKNFHVFECKRTKTTPIEDVYYFNAKIIDYALKFNPESKPFLLKGTFVSYNETGDQSLTYALAYGLEIIDPVTPPLEIVVGTAKDTNLKNAVEHFRETLPRLEKVLFKKSEDNVDPAELCKMYRFYVRRWAAQNGQHH